MVTTLESGFAGFLVVLFCLPPCLSAFVRGGLLLAVFL